MKTNFYVTASDKVWGDKLIAACNSHQKAQEIFDKWQNRSDLKYVMYDENLIEMESCH